MDYKVTYYPESKFGGFTDIDGTIAFYTRVNSLLDPSMLILDVGCGRGAWAEDTIRLRRNLRVLRGKCKKVIGIDVDANAQAHPFLDEFRLIVGSTWPLEDEAADICVCDSVLEHVENPRAFISECRRVLKEEGYLCIRTTNALSYIGCLARWVPNRFHGYIISKVQPNRKEEDVFPTLYRCNTKGKLRRLLTECGFDNCVYGYEAEPSYLGFSQFLYFLGVIH